MKKLVPIILLALVLAFLAYRLTARDRKTIEPISFQGSEAPASAETELVDTKELEPTITEAAPTERSDLTKTQKTEPKRRKVKRSSGKRTIKEETTAVLRGRILNADKKPIAKVKVYAGDRLLDWDWPLDAPAWGRLAQFGFRLNRVPFVTETNKSGFFEVKGLSPGRARLLVRHPGHAYQELDGLVLAPDSPLILDPIVIEPGLPVSGRILDSEGRVVGSTLVGALPAERAHWTTGALTAMPIARTNARGEFLSSSLPAGDWHLFFHSERSPDHSELISHDAENISPYLAINFPDPRLVWGKIPNRAAAILTDYVVHAIPVDQVQTLPPGGGRADPAGLDREALIEKKIRQLDELHGTRNPVPACFQTNYSSSPILGDGTFRALHLKPGVAYSLRALHRAEGFLVADAFSTPELLLPRSEIDPEGIKTFGEEFVELDVRPTLIYQPQFKVGNSNTAFQSPLRVRGGARRVPLLGRFSGPLAVRPTETGATQFTLEVDSPFYEKTEIFAAIPKEDRMDVLPLLESLKSAVTVRVKVTGPKGKAVEGAHVFLAEAFGVLEPRRRTSAITDSNGVATLRDMPSSRRNLGVSAPGLAPVFLSSPFKKTRGGGVQVKLEAGTSVRCQVANSYDEPIRGALVLRLIEDDERADLFGWDGGSAAIRYSDENGVAQFQALGTGRHRFAVLRAGRLTPQETAKEKERRIRRDTRRRERERKKERPGDKARLVIPSDALLETFERIDWDTSSWVDITDENRSRTLTKRFGIDLRGALKGIAYQNDKPLVDARVAFFMDGEASPRANTRTDLAGKFEFAELPAGFCTIEFRHHEWDLPLRQRSHVSTGTEVEQIWVNTREYGLQLSAPHGGHPSLGGFALRPTSDPGSRWHHDFGLSEENIDALGRVGALLDCPAPYPVLAVSNALGGFKLRLPELPESGTWVLQDKDLVPTVAQSVIASTGGAGYLNLASSHQLVLEGFKQFRSEDKTGWIGLVPRLADKSHWGLSRSARMPTDGDNLVFDKVPGGIYNVLAFDRDGFGRPTDVRILGKKTLSGKNEVRFTIRQL